MKYLSSSFTIILFLSFLETFSQTKNKSDYNIRTVQTILLDSVWAANKVSFALKTVGSKQFVSYYNKDRMMTVASRNLKSNQFQKTILSTKLNWDSHDYVAMGMDELGYIHVSGNMHVNPLVYYRSKSPHDISDMLAINKMVGTQEQDVTYPKFFNDKKGNLYFSYRTGSSGNGNTLINRFYTDTKTWKRYLPAPLFDGLSGKESSSSYYSLGKDAEGNFQCSWMWRLTPLVSSSYQVCYATSTDLIHWKNVAGKSIDLPFKPNNQDLIVDNVPAEAGLHNGRLQLINTPDNKPLLGYVKYDENGNTQLYLAHYLNNNWISKKISNWNFRWKFKGGGDEMTEGANFKFQGFSKEGFLSISYQTEVGDTGTYVVNPSNLSLINKAVIIKPKYPDSVFSKISSDPALSISLAVDDGMSDEVGVNYVLKWETLPKSHGSHAPKIIPTTPISPLYLLKNKVEIRK